MGLVYPKELASGLCRHSHEELPRTVRIRGDGMRFFAALQPAVLPWQRALGSKMGRGAFPEMSAHGFAAAIPRVRSGF